MSLTIKILSGKVYSTTVFPSLNELINVGDMCLLAKEGELTGSLVAKGFSRFSSLDAVAAFKSLV